MKYRFIAIEGNIGVGKTTLAEKLAELKRAQLVIEDFAGNPFLADFYKSPELNAFTVETAFLLDRCRQLKQLFKAGHPVIADYAIDKALVFSNITLNQKQAAVFRELYNLLTDSLPKPDLIIYLHNNVDQVRKNILARGRSYETLITEEYLQKLEHSYADYFANQNNVPVIYLDITGSPFLNEKTVEETIAPLLEQSWPMGLIRVKAENLISQ